MREKSESRLTCGIVMPISAIDGYPESHWTDVLAILSSAIEGAGFDPNLVSNAEDAGIIQTTSPRPESSRSAARIIRC